MRLTYETGTATLIQFIVLGLLNIADALQSIISTCAHSGGDCVGNLLSSIIFYFLIVIWFGIILIIGFGAQQRRNKRLAELLILAELAVIVVAAYNIKLDHFGFHNGILSLVTSIIDIILCGWVIKVAYQLTKASSGRVVKRQRRRHSKDSSHQA
jgi:Ca2+/Na+ antiporter